MDITGLNFDCLIKVHGYFDLQCLFNVGVTNGWLGTAAQYIYKQKFGALKVELDPSEERAAPLIVGDTIRVGGLKMCLQFLRCFGPALTNLAVMNCDHLDDDTYSYVKHHMEEYCTEKLVEMALYGVRHFERNLFAKSFGRVERMLISRMVLGKNQLVNLIETFPSLAHLRLHRIQASERFTMDESFQQLKSVSVYNHTGGNQNEFIADFLSGAPMVNSLDIDINGQRQFRIDALLEMIKNAPHLTRFVYDADEMDKRRPVNVNPTAIYRIITRHPMLVHIDLPQFEFAYENIIAIVNQLNSLEYFRASMSYRDYKRLKQELKTEWYTVVYERMNFNGVMIVLVSLCRIGSNKDD